MTDLREILPNRGLLASMLEQGYIRQQQHPTEPLFILNYTEKATFGRVWNDATRMCRGFIINPETYEVVARPFPKFHNHNEPDAPYIDPAEPVYVNDKMDGSLGILYWKPRAREWAIATRGSFMSDQAQHGSAKLRDLMKEDIGNREYFPDNRTLLFEIVYPENRIVLDYGDTDELVYLASTEKRTGHVQPVTERLYKNLPGLFGWAVTQQMPAETLTEALSLPDRRNAEGVVVTCMNGPNPQRMVKIKQSDYVALHRTISNLSAKVLWERMGNGETLKDLKYGLPEEFWEFVEATYYDLKDVYYRIKGDAGAMYSSITAQLDRDKGKYMWQRKDFAQHSQVASYPNRNLLFLLLDERDISEVVWKSLKPRGDEKFFSRSEDVS